MKQMRPGHYESFYNKKRDYLLEENDKYTFNYRCNHIKRWFKDSGFNENSNFLFSGLCEIAAKKEDILNDKRLLALEAVDYLFSELKEKTFLDKKNKSYVADTVIDTCIKIRSERTAGPLALLAREMLKRDSAISKNASDRIFKFSE